MTTPRNIIFFLAFLEGFSVLAVELIGGKMASVYYGNSIYVWTSILGITILGLAIGYFLGGKLAKKEKEGNVYKIFLLAALSVALMPGWGNMIMKMTMVLGYQSGVVLSCILFLAPTMTLLGMIPPTLINSLSKSINNSGTITGSLFAISSIGGIFSVIIIGFFVIPAYGFKSAISTIAVFLAIIPFIYFFKRKVLWSIGILFVITAIILVTMKPVQKTKNSHLRILHKSDGLMGQLMVADDLNTQKRSLLINHISQTYMHVPSGRSQWRYVHRLALYSSFMPAGSSVLLCGIGGGNVVNEMIQLGFSVDAVDLDARMSKIASKYFNMRNEASVFADDARHFIRTCNKKYDIVILDISAGENQPSNVYTLECFKEIKGLLTKDGVIFLHYQNVLEGENAIAIKSLARTLDAAGFYTQVINTDKVNSEGINQFWDITSELMVFGSVNEINLNDFSFARRDRFGDPFGFPISKSVFINNYSYDEGLILTDDKPIMDILHNNTLDATRGATLNDIIPIFIKENIEIL